MIKKYEMIKDTTSGLYRIKALINIPRFGVAIGDFGGLIESEKNLDHHGDAWVADNALVIGSACVADNARVTSNARVTDNALVMGNTRVGGGAWVADNARVADNACVTDNAHVMGNARVGGNAWMTDNARVTGDACVTGNAHVGGKARVEGNAWVTGDVWVKSPLYIAGSKYSLTNSKHGYIKIGCLEHTFEYWDQNYAAIGEANGFTQDEIKEYGEYIKLFIKLGVESLRRLIAGLL